MLHETIPDRGFIFRAICYIQNQSCNVLQCPAKVNNTSLTRVLCIIYKFSLQIYQALVSLNIVVSCYMLRGMRWRIKEIF